MAKRKRKARKWTCVAWCKPAEDGGLKTKIVNGNEQPVGHWNQIDAAFEGCTIRCRVTVVEILPRRKK